MIIFLRLFFLVVLGSMLAVTSWASWQCPIFSTPREIVTHPWFIATLFDAYWGFLTFYVWVWYQQTHLFSRIAWLIAILLLGNIAMALYCLVALFRVPVTTPLAEVLTLRQPHPSTLGGVLAVAGVGVWLIA